VTVHSVCIFSFPFFQLLLLSFFDCVSSTVTFILYAPPFSVGFPFFRCSFLLRSEIPAGFFSFFLFPRFFFDSDHGYCCFPAFFRTSAFASHVPATLLSLFFFFPQYPAHPFFAWPGYTFRHFPLVRFVFYPFFSSCSSQEFI